MNAQNFIPFHRPCVGEEEIQEVVHTLRSGWLTTGPKTALFEQQFRSYTGARHALALSSGTAALHLALAALNVHEGDEVITTPVTFCATVSAILHLGATPVLADVGEDGNIDPSVIRKRITVRTRGIIPVHLAGLPCAMDEIWELAREHKLFVVEDAAHAVGAHYRQHHHGSAQSGPSDAVGFSFYATKNLTTGEGGMVTTNNDSLAARMRLLALHGMSKDAWNRYSAAGKWRYDVMEPGFKYNLSDIQSSLGIHQLRSLESNRSARAACAEFYSREFAGMDELETPPECDYGRHAWHLYVLRLNLDKLNIDRDGFVKGLHQRGIGVSVHFIPINLHPFFSPWADQRRNHCPRALADFERSFSLPLYPTLTAEEMHRVVWAVKEIVSATTKRRCLALHASVA